MCSAPMSALKFNTVGMLIHYNTLGLHFGGTCFEFQRVFQMPDFNILSWRILDKTYKQIILFSSKLLICSPYFYPIRHHMWRRNGNLSDRILKWANTPSFQIYSATFLYRLVQQILWSCITKGLSSHCISVNHWIYPVPKNHALNVYGKEGKN